MKPLSQFDSSWENVSAAVKVKYISPSIRQKMRNAAENVNKKIEQNSQVYADSLSRASEFMLQ